MLYLLKKIHMKTIPIYLRTLKLRNIKTFGETTLNFENKDGILPQWTLILGDNGIGKSTLLQCMAWMKPFLPFKKDETPENFFYPSPIINDEENDSLARLVRKIPEHYNDGAYIKALFQANRNLKTKKVLFNDVCLTSIKIQLDNKGKLTEVNPSLMARGESFYNNEVVIYAYSAARILGKANMEGSELEDTIPGFINEKTVLYDAQELLHTINYATLGSQDDEKEKYINFFNKVKQMLVSLLPDFQNVTDIKITSPKLVDNKLKQGELLITTKHGKEIPFEDFSLGYKTVLSWSVDLAWRLFNKYSESTNPLAEPAIVLIDEIDLHLHPTWQIDIINNLSKHFPNVQFIATAHSPLMVQAAVDANYVIVKFCEDDVRVINEPVGIDGWRVDQILTSEFFDLDSTRGPEFSKLLKRRSVLIQQGSLNSKQENELKEINEKLSQYPSGNNPDEIDDRKIIRKIITDFKESGKVIKI